MTHDDLLKEILIDRVLLIILLLGGGATFAYLGFLTWVTLNAINRRIAEFDLLTRLLIAWLRKEKGDSG